MMDHANRVPASKSFHCQGVKVIPRWRTSPRTFSPSHSGNSPQCPAPSGTTEAAWSTDYRNIKRSVFSIASAGRSSLPGRRPTGSLTGPSPAFKVVPNIISPGCLLPANPTGDCVVTQDVPHTPAPRHWTLNNLHSVLLISVCSSVQLRLFSAAETILTYLQGRQHPFLIILNLK